jgi:1,4-alpha-glucan branching enzyme
MKKFKNTLNKAEPVKAEPAKAGPVKIIAARPEVPKIGRVSFALVKPDAKNVYVAGDFNDWKPERAPLVPTGNGRWVGDLTLKPGRHEYLFVVDGQWMPDPNAKESVQNPFGGRNSILGVSE